MEGLPKARKLGKPEGEHPKVKTVLIWGPMGLLSREGAWPSLNSQWGLAREKEAC